MSPKLVVSKPVEIYNSQYRTTENLITLQTPANNIPYKRTGIVHFIYRSDVLQALQDGFASEFDMKLFWLLACL